MASRDVCSLQQFCLPCMGKILNILTAIHILAMKISTKELAFPSEKERITGFFLSF
jgi:hypothetical protein